MPFSETMHRGDKARSGTALGGLGTGFFELRKDGTFRTWNIFNNSPGGTGAPFDMPEDSMLFFILRYQVEGEYPQMKVLQIDEGYKVAGIPDHYYTYPWLSGVDRIEWSASFPFVHMTFSDDEMPLDVEMEAFSPFIPHDVKNSALPAAVFRFKVRPKTDRPVDVMLMASMHNGVGYDVEDKHHVSTARRRKGYRLIELTEEMDRTASSWGSQVLASLAPDSTHYLGWEAAHPYYEIVIRNRELPNTDDTDGRNKIDPATGKLRAMYQLYGSIAVSRLLKRRRALDHTFVMGWHFPNLYNRDLTRVEGRYYANFFDSATEVVDYTVRNLEGLRARTRKFADDFRDSTAPGFVLDQVQSHLNTFVTSSWLTRGADFGVQEGLSPHRAYGPLATVDVSTYGAMSTAALFPELFKNMMRAHRRLQGKTGEVAHGINRDFTQHDRQEAVTGRLDLPSQYVILSLLGFFWTGDRKYLDEMWPSIKKALDYVLDCRDPNGDYLPDMAGAMCTYDNFAMFGASSYVSSLWLAALMAAIEAAGVVGDAEAAARYSDVLGKARACFEEKLWNGSYYRLYNDEGGERGDLDEGCLSDQVIGQWLNHLTGLGDTVQRSRAMKALRTVCRICRQPWGLVNCRWPDDEFLHDIPESCWHDQANTCWSGVELAFASFLIYEGMWKQGVGVVADVDRRYRKAGLYWDHIEFGGHYYRPMSAWAVVNAMLGLTMRDGAYGFAPKVPGEDLKLFFSFGQGTAHYVRQVTGKGERLGIEIRTGRFHCRRLTFELLRAGASKVRLRAGGRAVARGDYEATFEDGALTLAFRRGLSLAEGEALRVTVQ